MARFIHTHPQCIFHYQRDTDSRSSSLMDSTQQIECSSTPSIRNHSHTSYVYHRNMPWNHDSEGSSPFRYQKIINSLNTFINLSPASPRCRISNPTSTSKVLTNIISVNSPASYITNHQHIPPLPSPGRNNNSSNRLCPIPTPHHHTNNI